MENKEAFFKELLSLCVKYSAGISAERTETDEYHIFIHFEDTGEDILLNSFYPRFGHSIVYRENFEGSFNERESYHLIELD